MENNTHKGSELKNVSDTWDQNEKLRKETGGARTPENRDLEETGSSDLERVIKQEAAAYDNDNKEDRLLGGERASINDTGTGSADE